MKNKFYSIIVIIFTLLTTGWIFYIGTIDGIDTLTLTYENESVIDDITLDTFIRIYATEILNQDHYEITTENRENIRSLLSSMGESNIQLLKESVFQKSQQKIIDAIKKFCDENFLWEEKALLKQYISQ